MGKVKIIAILLPFFLFAQSYSSLGKSRIFLNSFLNLEVFPSSINGYSNFISTGSEEVRFLYKFRKDRGTSLWMREGTIYSGFNLTRGFLDLAVLGSYSHNSWGGVIALGYSTPFSRLDVSGSLEDGDFRDLNLKFEREISSQKMFGVWVNLTRDSVTALLDLMIAPTENRVFFAGIGGSSEKNISITAGGYFPVFDWLYLEISGDFVYEEDTTYVVKRWGIGVEYSDFLAEFQLDPRLMGYVPYIFTGRKVDYPPLISVSLMYRFHTF